MVPKTLLGLEDVPPSVGERLRSVSFLLKTAAGIPGTGRLLEQERENTPVTIVTVAALPVMSTEPVRKPSFTIRSLTLLIGLLVLVLRVQTSPIYGFPKPFLVSGSTPKATPTYSGTPVRSLSFPIVSEKGVKRDHTEMTMWLKVPFICVR